MRQPLVERCCDRCGGEYQCTPAAARRRRYCSVRCANRAVRRRADVVVDCLQCGLPLSKLLARINQWTGRGMTCRGRCRRWWARCWEDGTVHYRIPIALRSEDRDVW